MARRRPETAAWWRRRSIVIPPETPEEWLRLVAFEIWMGMLLCLLIAVGTRLIVTAPDYTHAELIAHDGAYAQLQRVAGG